MGKPGVKPITDFKNFPELASYVDKMMTPEEIERKYSIEEPRGDILGTSVIPLPDGYRAIKVTKWTEGFADELCKAARWCVRNPNMFEEEYKINEGNPLYLLLRGNNQVALLSLRLAEFKDVQDASLEESRIIPKERLPQIYKIVSALARAEGTSLPMSGDYSVFMSMMMEDGSVSPNALIDTKKRLAAAEVANSEAEATGDEEPYTYTELEDMRSLIEELMTKYAPQYVELVGKSNLPARDILRIVREIYETNKARGRRNEEAGTGNVPYPSPYLKRALGDVFAMLLDREDLDKGREGEVLSLLSKVSPVKYLTWLEGELGGGEQKGPWFYRSNLSRLFDRDHILSVLGLDRSLEENGEPSMFAKRRDRAIKAMYPKLLNHPKASSIMPNTAPIGREREILMDAPAPSGKTILKDVDGFWLIDIWHDDKKLLGLAMRVGERLRQLKGTLSQAARDMVENGTLDKDTRLTAEEARRVYLWHVGSGQWDYRREDYGPRFEATDDDASEKFKREIHFDPNFGGPLEEIVLALGFAEFTRRILDWDGSFSTFFKGHFQDNIDQDVSSLKSRGWKVAEPSGQLVSAWLRGMMKR